MPLITRTVYKFRCDRCGNHATFDGGDAWATPPFDEQLETLRADGWTVDGMWNDREQRIICPLHEDMIYHEDTIVEEDRIHPQAPDGFALDD